MCNCETCKKIRSIYEVIKKLDEPDKKTIEGLLMDLVYTEEDYSLYRTLYPDVSCAFLCELQTRDLLKDFQKDINDLFEKYKKQF